MTVFKQFPWLPDWVGQMVKYGLKGGTGMLVNVVLLTVVVEWGGITRELGVPVVWLLTLIPGYLLVDKWVFSMFPSPDGLVGNAERTVGFYGIMWVGKGTNYVLYLALITGGVPYQLAWVVGAIIVFPWTFGANRWLWKRDYSVRQLVGRIPGLRS